MREIGAWYGTSISAVLGLQLSKMKTANFHLLSLNNRFEIFSFFKVLLFLRMNKIKHSERMEFAKNKSAGYC